MEFKNLVTIFASIAAVQAAGVTHSTSTTELVSAALVGGIPPDSPRNVAMKMMSAIFKREDYHKIDTVEKKAGKAGGGIGKGGGHGGGGHGGGGHGGGHKGDGRRGGQGDDDIVITVVTLRAHPHPHAHVTTPVRVLPVSTGVFTKSQTTFTKGNFTGPRRVNTSTVSNSTTTSTSRYSRMSTGGSNYNALNVSIFGAAVAAGVVFMF